ncbi:MAG: riboflavin synthase [Euryarchaeota archaeon]|nr:riboflavin synthase [Euryarchaeota archaeon]|tara:strand:+ start:6465 stop:7064 length:600 start_codon:yes stop_codon:yes gene_type:complete
MFTGIVQGTGQVLSIEQKQSVSSLSIRLPNTAGLQIGASVAVNGVCLTATLVEQSTAVFDVIPETLERTTLGDLEINDKVNIERSLKFGDEIGGHLLSGHIMGAGIVRSKLQNGEGMDFSIMVAPEMQKYVMEKGYIAIDGISLTIGSVENGCFSLHIIPETLRITTLGAKQVGDAVNLEIDSTTQTIVSTVERVLREQ